MRSKNIVLLGLGLALASPAIAGVAATASAGESKPAKVAPEIAPPPAGMGQVVFYRPSSMGALVSCRVNEGAAVVNKLPPGRYFVHQTTPGVHEYSVHSEAKDALRVNVEEGETHYARCAIRMGIMVGRPNLSTQDRADFDKRGTSLKLQQAFATGKDKDKDEPAEAGAVN
jgi:hypothetical protein